MRPLTFILYRIILHTAAQTQDSAAAALPMHLPLAAWHNNIPDGAPHCIVLQTDALLHFQRLLCTPQSPNGAHTVQRYPP